MQPRLNKNSDLEFNLESFKNYLEEHREQVAVEEPNEKISKFALFVNKVKIHKKPLIIASSVIVCVLVVGSGFFIAGRYNTPAATDQILIADRASELAVNDEENQITPTPDNSSEVTLTPTVTEDKIETTPEVTTTPTIQQTVPNRNTATKPVITTAPVTQKTNTGYTPASTPSQTTIPTQITTPTPTAAQQPTPTVVTTTPTPLPTVTTEPQNEITPTPSN